MNSTQTSSNSRMLISAYGGPERMSVITEQFRDPGPGEEEASGVVSRSSVNSARFFVGETHQTGNRGAPPLDPGRRSAPATRIGEGGRETCPRFFLNLDSQEDLPDARGTCLHCPTSRRYCFSGGQWRAGSLLSSGKVRVTGVSCTQILLIPQGVNRVR